MKARETKIVLLRRYPNPIGTCQESFARLAETHTLTINALAKTTLYPHAGMRHGRVGRTSSHAPNIARVAVADVPFPGKSARGEP